MKINYLILAHKNLDQLKRLITRLSIDNPSDFSIYIHIDKKWELSRTDIDSITNIHKNISVIPSRISCKLDEWSLIDATLKLIKFSLIKDSSDAYNVLMSGQDYPIKSNSKFVEFCEDNYPKPLIDVTPWAQDNWINFKFRHSIIYKSLSQIQFNNRGLNFALRIVKGGIDCLIPKQYTMRFKLGNIGLKLYGGSAWWVLPTQVLKEIIKECEVNSRLIQLYQKTLTPEETFFQTMTMRTSLASLVEVNPPEQISQNCPTFAYFNPRGKKFTGHPYIITSEIWPEIQSYNNFFARKFDMSIDSKIFDTIDNHIQRDL